MFPSLASTIEAACESGFQFYFQLSYLLPSILISIAVITQNLRDDNEDQIQGGGGGSIEDLINAKTLSIVFSFFSISKTFCVIR